MTGWFKREVSKTGLSLVPPILFNLYIRELGMRIEECQEGLKYTSVHINGELKRCNLAGLMYVNDVCLFVESANALQRVS